LNGTRRKQEKAKRFFFEKKNQKTFVPVHTPPDRTATATQKSFASRPAGAAFSSERKILLS
jgi:hypothetical protein